MNPGTFAGIPDGLSIWRPQRVITYTSGTGTFTPLVSNSWCRITLVGGGAGGARCSTTSGGGGGGGAGAAKIVWMRLSGAVSYAVGAAGVGATANGTVGTAGGFSRIDSVAVMGGRVPPFTATQGGVGGYLSTYGTAENGAVSFSGGASGEAGGHGGEGGGIGGAVGFAIPTGGSTMGGAAAGVGSANPGGGGGGSSLYGMGGAGGAGSATTASAGANATGYGGGGGGGGAGATSGNGGNGSGGLIIIEEFGAV